MSLTCDKAQVGGLGLLAGAFCCPDGHAALSVIQALRRGKIHRIMSVSRAKTHRSRTPKLLVYSFCWCIYLSCFVWAFRIHQSFGTRTFLLVYSFCVGFSYTPKFWQNLVSLSQGEAFTYFCPLQFCPSPDANNRGCRYLPRGIV